MRASSSKPRPARVGFSILLAYLVVAIVAGPAAVHAQERLGGEFRVNTYTTGSQRLPSVAMDPDGNFVVVWESSFQVGNDISIFGQRFLPSGLPAGPELQLNTYTTSDQRRPSVAMDGAGNFVVVWESNGQDGSGYGVIGRRFFASGLPAGPELPVNTYTTSSQSSPSVAMGAGDDFVVVWQSAGQDGSSFGIFGQRFDGGTSEGPEFQGNTYSPGFQFRPSVAADAGGDFVVVWESADQDGSNRGIFGQRFTSDGNPLDVEFQVNTYTTSYQALSAVAMDGAGNFVVVWTSLGQDGSSYGIFGQRYESNGNAVDDEFQVNTYTTSYQARPAVAMDAAGNFVVVWQSYQDGSDYGIFGQRFTSSGNPIGGEFPVNSYTTSPQRFPAVAMDADGNFVVVWESYDQDGSSSGVFGQRFRFGELDFFIGDAEEGAEGDPPPRPIPAAGSRR